jgi:type II secretory pathway component HofQ
VVRNQKQKSEMKKAKNDAIKKIARVAGYTTAKDDSIRQSVEIGDTFVLIDDHDAVVAQEEKRKAILVVNGSNVRLLYFKQLARVARIEKDGEAELLDGGEPSKEWHESGAARSCLKRWVADQNKRAIKCSGHIDHYRTKFVDGKPVYDGDTAVLEKKRQPIWEFVKMTDTQYESALKNAGLID